MTAWKKHNVSKAYIDLRNQHNSYRNNAINGIDLLIKAILRKPLHEIQFGTKASDIVINDTIFINFGCYTINRQTLHIRFNGGFIPLSRINRVDIV